MIKLLNPWLSYLQAIAVQQYIAIFPVHFWGQTRIALVKFTVPKLLIIFQYPGHAFYQSRPWNRKDAGQQ
jgi:hypothetical protein